MTERKTLPVIPLRASVIFPGSAVPISVGREASLRAVQAANEADGYVFAVAQRQNVDRPSPADLHTLGVIAKISELQSTQGGVQVLLQGEVRASALEYRPVADHLQVVCLPVNHGVSTRLMKASSGPCRPSASSPAAIAVTFLC